MTEWRGNVEIQLWDSKHKNKIPTAEDEFWGDHFSNIVSAFSEGKRSILKVEAAPNSQAPTDQSYVYYISFILSHMLYSSASQFESGR